MKRDPTFNATQLEERIQAQEIDTVIVCFPDMQGRLVGKRLTARFFLDSAMQSGIAACDYLLTVDLALEAVEGYAASSWDTGYGDLTLMPDMATLRFLPWAPKTALLIADVLGRDGIALAHSPRQILKNQLARLVQKGCAALCATELEFYLFQGSYADLFADNYRTLSTLGHFNSDYQIFQTEREEPLMRQIRNQLQEAGVAVEGSMGECSPGQQELNLCYGPMLDMADNHALAKLAIKTLAQQQGHSASFLAKWHVDYASSSSHIHLSLWDEKAERPLFLAQEGRADNPYAMSPLMEKFLAGLLAHTHEAALFYAPYPNSYQRFLPYSFAPSRLVWALDNRSAAFRLCAPRSKGIRIENRLAGADANPYLAFAAMLAAGLTGLERDYILPPAATGNLYLAPSGGESAPQQWPTSLEAAIDLARASDWMQTAFGAGVVTHYAHAANWELSEYQRHVGAHVGRETPPSISHWELARGFERV